MAAVKWFGSNKADERSAIAWEVSTRKELEEAAATAPEEVPPLVSQSIIYSIHNDSTINSYSQTRREALSEAQRMGAG